MKRSASNAARKESANSKRLAAGQRDASPPTAPPVPTLEEMLARQLPHLQRNVSAEHWRGDDQSTGPCTMSWLADAARFIQDSEDECGDWGDWVGLVMHGSTAADGGDDGGQSIHFIGEIGVRDRQDTSAYRRFHLTPQLHGDRLPFMTFPQLLRLINMPAELVPPALLQRVRFTRVSTEVLLDTSSGVALFVQGHAECGPSGGDRLVFFQRLAPAPRPTVGQPDPPLMRQLYTTMQSPLNRYLQLQHRPLLDPVNFPQLATLTHGRCLEPEYVYVLCETESGVELTSAQGQALLHTAVDRWYPHFPIRFCPTNAVYALQPHLPSSCLQLPLSALVTIASRNQMIPAPSTITAAQPSLPTNLLVDLQQSVVELLLECLSFLDTNSLLYGALPAMHSLPAVTAKLNSSVIARRVLLSRFGAASDVELWSEQLLSEWRREGFDKKRAAVKQRYMYRWAAEKKKQAIATASEQVDREELQAGKREVHWAAIFDLQARANRYLIRVMLQAKEHILPQLYPSTAPPSLPQPSTTSPVSAPGTVRPVFLVVPDLVLELLLCVPPFHPPLTAAGRSRLGTYKVCTPVSEPCNASPHHVDFAPLLYYPQMSDDMIHYDYEYDEYVICALYMGPVYVYDNQHTAGKGVVVDMAELRTLSDKQGRPLIAHDDNRQRVVRQLFIDDVNQLPVIARTVRYESKWVPGRRIIHPEHQTVRACFGKRGVLKLMAETRARWRRVVVCRSRIAALSNPLGTDTSQLSATTAAQDAEDAADEQNREEEQHEKAADEVERNSETEDEWKEDEKQAREEAKAEEEEEEEEEWWDEEPCGGCDGCASCSAEVNSEDEGDEYERCKRYEQPDYVDTTATKHEYVQPLMKALFKKMNQAMHPNDSWTSKAATEEEQVVTRP